MSRKVFISVLGTGFYGKCAYKKDNFQSSDTRFIQAATLEMLKDKSEWTEADRGYIFLTDGARRDNWQPEGNKRKKFPKAQEEDYEGLKDELDGMHLPFEIEPVSIPDGKDKEEIWNIFDIIYDKLEEDDELYFDVTHGFRYLPMLVLVLANYAKFLKKVKVEMVTYGNYEARTKSPDVAPIVDITSLSVLQDWTNAASDYLRHGDARVLKECCMSGLKPILVEKKGSDVEANNLRKLVDKLNDFSENLSFCRGLSVYQGKDAQEVGQYAGSVTGNYLKPFLPLLTTIKDTVNGYSENAVKNFVRSAQLCLEHENYQACVTLLQEGIVTFFCLRHGISAGDEKKRGCVNQAITKKQLDLENRLAEYKPFDNADKEALVDEVYHDELITKEFINDYSNLTDVRNDMNHAGMRSNKNPMSAKALRKNIEKSVRKFSTFLNVDIALPEPPAVPCKHLFINLSNHHSAMWSEEQRSAARGYGEIVDMPFPNVPPSDTKAQVETLATKQVDEILKSAQDAVPTVHVMGEMSLTFRIVQKLKAQGIRCVCSTTQRIVTERDGQKVTEFHFEHFREY